LAAGYYPTQGRATGVAWMLGIGRFGGIAGSFLVAELARRELAFSQVFSVIAAAALVSMAALLVKLMADRKGRHAGGASAHTRLNLH
jgi:AAHS family 4-hydroxybenzoate transporter-like MFS transporter